RVRAARLEKIDEGLWCLSLNYAVGYNDIGTMSAALVGRKGRDAETHWPAVILGCGGRDRGAHEGERRGQHRQAPRPEAGGR
ncbi:MAG TPA: hypothetical protein VGG86_01690, partial [Roseiarcus sp.]